LLLDERKDVHWAMDPQTGDAARSKILNSSREIEMCARCHARRSPISRDYVHGESLLNHYLPRLLDDGMYHADGQIDDEVYVYGSFLQSRMYQAGVTCSDCHEPHSTKLRIPGNGVCLQCHLGSKYDQPGHHFHKAGTDGARCAECHMPPKSYMVVDPRHDHSMRIPRPDLSVALGTPNACSHCHQDKSAAWADRQVKAWYGKQTAGFQGYAAALHGARHGEPGSGDALAALVRETRTPAIARATALTAIGPYLSQSTLDVLPTGLSDSDPLVRQAAVGLLDRLPVQMRAANALPLLDDPVRAVRIEAARVLAPLPADRLTGDQQARLKQVTDEYVEAQLVSAERPEAQTNLGDLYAAMGQSDKAVTAYRTASELNPGYTPAYVNLADHYRAQGDENRVETVLREAVGRIPGDASIHHALGLALVRQKRLPEAVEELRLAANLAPNDVRYTYVYAVALNSSGKEEQAIQILRGVHERHPGNREILSALVAFHRDAGNSAAARSYADKLQKLSP
jgi:tetratricopeptide (TPR) repeat protein